MNKTIIIGNVCHTPETRSTTSGNTVCSFTVAVNKKRNGEDISTFFRVSAWNKLAETCQQYVAKGMKIMVEGEVSAMAYMSKDNAEPRASLELMANNVEFLSPRQQNSQPQFTDQRDETEGWQELTDGDLPF